MAAQVTMLASPANPVSPVLSKKVVPWIPASAPNSASQQQRSENRVAHQNAKIRTNAQANPKYSTQRQPFPFDISAHSLQFVASPGQSDKLQTLVPAAIRRAFCDVSAFTGCMVMVSDQEARRVTIVTLWKGNHRSQQCTEYAHQLRMMLLPYVDHWLRAENHVANFFLCPIPDQAVQNDCPVPKCDPTVNA